MPVRWVVSPIVEIEPDPIGAPGEILRRPYVATLLDPGRPGKEYVHSSVYFESQGKCLSFASGADLSTLDSDGDVYDVLERDYEEVEDFLNSTPNLEGWSQGRINSSKNRLQNLLGANMTGIDGDTPFAEWLDRAIEAEYGVHPHGHGGHAKNTYAKRGS